MIPGHVRIGHLSSRVHRIAPRYAVVIALTRSRCSTDWLPHVDPAPTYEPPEYVVPVSWKGSSPFVEASPSDGELRSDWRILEPDFWSAIRNRMRVERAADYELARLSCIEWRKMCRATAVMRLRRN